MSNLYAKVHSDTGKETTKTGNFGIGADFLVGDSKRHRTVVLVDIKHREKPFTPLIEIHKACEWCCELTNINDLIKVKSDEGEIVYICNECAELRKKQQDINSEDFDKSEFGD